MTIKKTIFISFYNSYPITSGASAVTTSTFLNWPGKKILFQLNHEKNKGRNDIHNYKIPNNSPLTKFFFLISFAFFILRKTKNEKISYIVFEGASWSGYSYIIQKILKNFLKNTKYIYHSHNIDYLFRKKNFWVKIISFFCEKKILENFDISTSVSKDDQKKFMKIFGVKTLLLPNGIIVNKKF